MLAELSGEAAQGGGVRVTGVAVHDLAQVPHAAKGREQQRKDQALLNLGQVGDILQKDDTRLGDSGYDEAP